MTRISIQNLSKKFGAAIAVDDLSIDLPDGKFICLLGPSGCGKTTLLRLIAGLEKETAGRILINGIDQSNIPAHKRNFGMVFQSLALFPHLNVAENITYPLKIRGMEDAVRRARAAELLELVKLPDIQDRQIHQLSGGQRQRVAIARGLAINPSLFLLDEPLSALDAKLREYMQIELRLLQQKLGITTIIVTHDQREAMTMADMVIIMDRGRLLQAGSPIEIYRRPANAFVASFIGTSNLIPCRRVGADTIEILGRAITIPTSPGGNPAIEIGIGIGELGTFSIRPEDVVIASEEKPHDFAGVVEFIRDLGASVEISVIVHNLKLLSVSTPKSRPEVEIGQSVGVKFHADRATVMAK